jgi:retron-type reverse transcriptase
MRAAQFRILSRLLEGLPIPEYIHAFERGKSIPVMAQTHIQKGLVISIDLKDFFHSIKQKHLLEMFQGLGVALAPAKLLSEVCTYKSFVPQGAITSPKLSNLVAAYSFGPVLKQFCDSKGYSLSIYADDVTISTPTDLISEGNGALVKEILDVTKAAVEPFGFRLNRKKTKVMRPFQRQYVCGVVVNAKSNLKRGERARLRAIVHNCKQNGLEAEAQKMSMSATGFASHIRGKLGWFNQLNPEAGGRLLNQFEEVLQQHQALSESGSENELPVTGVAQSA